MAEGETGLCGLRRVEGGLLRRTAGPATSARLQAYYDPHPTNCVGAWICPARTGAGFPKFARTRGPERGFKNLSVFYQACSFDCLNCQNWHFRMPGGDASSPAELAAWADERTSCICYFGGDPGPHLPHALPTSRRALQEARRTGRALRICFETNGALSPRLMSPAIALVLESGGLFKFDLKAHSEPVHRALTGSSNRAVLENFRLASTMIPLRPDPPPLMAATLLVPGYVDAREVGSIARFIASIDPGIPYSLLAFHPAFLLDDLPTTSKREAKEALEAARNAGLRRLNVGNIRLEDGVS
jgi:pyruvate formate lyase activating enzyme